MTPEAIALQLGKTGLCICADFLSLESLTETREDLQTLQQEKNFERASTGQGLKREIRSLVRSDDTYWLDRDQSTLVQKALWLKLDSLRQAFNRTLFLGLTGFEGHYAAYPQGGFYRRHLDAFQKEGGRIVSLILYLNSNWISSDGGVLRIYHQESHTDIAPVGGTLVCFLSHESEHEVLLSHSPRLSFAGWFK